MGNTVLLTALINQVLHYIITKARSVLFCSSRRELHLYVRGCRGLW